MKVRCANEQLYCGFAPKSLGLPKQTGDQIIYCKVRYPPQRSSNFWYVFFLTECWQKAAICHQYASVTGYSLPAKSHCFRSQCLKTGDIKHCQWAWTCECRKSVVQHAKWLQEKSCKCQQALLCKVPDDTCASKHYCYFAHKLCGQSNSLNASWPAELCPCEA